MFPAHGFRSAVVESGRQLPMSVGLVQFLAPNLATKHVKVIFDSQLDFFL